MSLSVQFLGMTLKNPVIVAAGPWSCDAAAIQKSIDAGAAAVVTETITLEASTRVCPRLYQHGGSLFNTMLYSTIDLEQWEQEIKRIDKRGSILICSVWGATESETAYIAKKVERLGADAIELSISAPIGTRSTRFGRFQEQIGGYVRAVVEAVDLPVMVKLSYDASANVAFVHAVEQAGAQAISAIDSLKGLAGVDIEHGMPLMPTCGGYSGANLRPVALATTATLAQLTRCEICGIGGIESYEHVLEYVMLGANAVQLASTVLLAGYERITRIVSDLRAWTDAHNTTLAAQHGRALQKLIPFEDIPAQQLVCAFQNPCTRIDCGLCAASCLGGGIRLSSDGFYTVDPDACTGCGLCAARCPEHRIRLAWR